MRKTDRREKAPETEFGRIVDQKMTERGYTKAYLAEKLGVGITVVSRYRFTQTPRPDTVRQLARIFRCKQSELWPSHCRKG